MGVGPCRTVDGVDPVSAPSLFRRARSWLDDHPFLTDLLIMLGLLSLGVSVAWKSVPEGSEQALSPLGWGLIVAMAVPLAWRRRAPVPVLWGVVLATVLFWILDFPDQPTGMTMLLAFYGVGAYHPRPASIRHLWAAGAVLLAVMVAGVLSSGEDLPVVSIPLGMALVTTAAVLGDNVQSRRQYLVELEHRATSAEARRVAEAERAVADERNRIARELHDVVAHSMSVVVVQAGAARRLLNRNPTQAGEALTTIEETGRESLQEMRRILGVLRTNGADGTGTTTDPKLAPAPSLADIGPLAEHCARAGLPVEVEVGGEVRKLAPGLELSAYRVVQESLTNSLKHAGPAATANVRLDYQDETLVVEVTDDGHGAAATPAPDAGRGQGLVGMRERVEAFDGEIEAGPRAGGGFAVTACFPTSAPVQA